MTSQPPISPLPPRPVSAQVSPQPRQDPEPESFARPSVPIGRPGPSSRYARQPERARPSQEFIRLGPKPPPAPKTGNGSEDSATMKPPPPVKPKPKISKPSVPFVEIPVTPPLPDPPQKRTVEARNRHNSEEILEDEAVPEPKKLKTEVNDETETVYDGEQVKLKIGP